VLDDREGVSLMNVQLPASDVTFAGQVLAFVLAVGFFILRTRVWIATAAVVTLAAWSLDASALTPPAGVIQPTISPTGRVVNWVSSANGTWSPSGAGGGGGIVTTVGKDFAMPGPGGRTTAARMTLGLTAGQVALAAARAAGYVGAAVWVGTELYDYWQDLRVQPDTAGSGVVGFDVGTEMTEASVWIPDDTKGGYCTQTGATPSAAYGAWRPCALARTAAAYPTYTVASGTPSTCNASTGTCSGGAFEVRYPGGGVAFLVGDGNDFDPEVQDVCPAWVDFYGNSIAQGSSTPGADGKCPTGIYEPITAAELAALRQANEGAGDIDLNELMAEILGKVPLPITSDSTVEVGNVIPSALTGPEKVTTSVEAGETVTTTEAIGWDWSRDPLRKTEGDWVETKTEVVRDSEGNIIRSTTTATAGKTDAEAAAESGDMCKSNPDAAGCLPLGTPAAAAAIPVVDTPASMDERVTFGAENAACPANRSLETTLAGTLQFSWEGPCMFADGIRPVVVGLAYLAAALSFFGLGRRD
jgi:hypothetical protein